MPNYTFNSEGVKCRLKVVEHNTTLKKLDIRGCTNLDNSVVNCIVSDVTGIEELLLRCYYDSILLNYRT